MTIRQSDNKWEKGICMLSRFICGQLFAMLWTVAHQAPLSIGFSKQGYRIGLPCPLPGYLEEWYRWAMGIL